MIKKMLFCAVALLAAVPAICQTNLQLHYDYGHKNYGKELKDRPELTFTIENVSLFDYGLSTYFFIALPNFLISTASVIISSVNIFSNKYSSVYRL